MNGIFLLINIMVATSRANLITAPQKKLLVFSVPQ